MVDRQPVGLGIWKTTPTGNPPCLGSCADSVPGRLYIQHFSLPTQNSFRKFCKNQCEPPTRKARTWGTVAEMRGRSVRRKRGAQFPGVLAWRVGGAHPPSLSKNMSPPQSFCFRVGFRFLGFQLNWARLNSLFDFCEIRSGGLVNGIKNHGFGVLKLVGAFAG